MELDVGAWARFIRDQPPERCGEIYVMFSQLAAIAASRLFLARPVQLGLDSRSTLVTPSVAARETGLPRRWFYDHPDHPAITRPSPGRILVDLGKLNGDARTR